MQGREQTQQHRREFARAPCLERQLRINILRTQGPESVANVKGRLHLESASISTARPGDAGFLY